MALVLQTVLHGLAIAPLAQGDVSGRIEWWQVLAVFVLSLVLVVAVRRTVVASMVWWKKYGAMVLGSALAMVALLSIPPNYPKIKEGQLRVTVLDVGQGTARWPPNRAAKLAVRRGAAVGGDADAGARVIVPHLRYIGVQAD